MKDELIYFLGMYMPLPASMGVVSFAVTYALASNGMQVSSGGIACGCGVAAGFLADLGIFCQLRSNQGRGEAIDEDSPLSVVVVNRNN